LDELNPPNIELGRPVESTQDDCHGETASEFDNAVILSSGLSAGRSLAPIPSSAAAMLATIHAPSSLVFSDSLRLCDGDNPVDMFETVEMCDVSVA
jgi:hypothetical protein